MCINLNRYNHLFVWVTVNALTSCKHYVSLFFPHLFIFWFQTTRAPGADHNLLAIVSARGCGSYPRRARETPLPSHTGRITNGKQPTCHRHAAAMLWLYTFHKMASVRRRQRNNFGIVENILFQLDFWMLHPAIVMPNHGLYGYIKQVTLGNIFNWNNVKKEMLIMML